MRPIDTTCDAFILASYEYMTVSDLVYETGKTQFFIIHNCKRLGITPIKRKKQVENFLREHTHWPIERLMKVLDMGRDHINGYLKEFNIELKPIPIKADVSNNQRTAFFTYVSDEMKEYMNNRESLAQMQNRLPPGSPLTDEVNNIQTTKRDMPNAFKAKII